MLGQVYSVSFWKSSTSIYCALADNYTTKDLIFRLPACLFVPFSMTIFVGGNPEVNIRWPKVYNSVYIGIKLEKIECCISL